MKFLKKFNTEEEYEAYLNSDDFVRPCVARIVDDKAVRYKKRYKNVVYVQHVDGKLFTTEQWTEKGFANDVANGVAVATNKVEIVIAKESLGLKYWSSDFYNAVDGIMITTDSAIAMTDYMGYNNTSLMLATDTSGAGFSCANYAFPNGQKGYLPSLGEWVEAYKYKTLINEAMSLIGGAKIPTNDKHWSSTQEEANSAWNFDWSKGLVDTHYKYYSGQFLVRPFTTL